LNAVFGTNSEFIGNPSLKYRQANLAELALLVA